MLMKLTAGVFFKLNNLIDLILVTSKIFQQILLINSKVVKSDPQKSVKMLKI